MSDRPRWPGAYLTEDGTQWVLPGLADWWKVQMTDTPKLSPIQVRVTDKNTGEVLEEFVAFTDFSEWRGIQGSRTGTALACLEDCPQFWKWFFRGTFNSSMWMAVLKDSTAFAREMYLTQLWPTKGMRESFNREVSYEDWRGV